MPESWVIKNDSDTISVRDFYARRGEEGLLFIDKLTVEGVRAYLISSIDRDGFFKVEGLVMGSI